MRRPHAYTRLKILVGFILISCLLSVPDVMSHSPLIPENNERLSGATLISDPTKSWAIYGELNEGGEVQYYRFNISQAQRIHISLMKSTNPEDREFTPGFVLMGPEIKSRGDVPDHVELPAGTNAIVAVGEQPAQATYEPFSASSFYSLAELDMQAPASGTYYIAVYEPLRGGHYGLAIGDREVFSIGEWILIPIKLISIYQWDGQSLAMIFLPIAATLGIGSGLLFLRRKRWATQTPFEWTGLLAGLLFLSTGVMFLFQMSLALTHTRPVAEMVITITLALLPILFGIAVLRIIMKSQGKVDVRKRVFLAIFGILALFAWAGLLIGPVLAVLASIMPASGETKTKMQRIEE